MNVTPDLPSQIIDLLRQRNHSVNRRTDQILLEQLGVGLSQYRILNEIQQQQVATAQRQLADKLNQTEAAISRQIKLLISKGLVQSDTDETEKRKNLVSLTPSGVKITIAASELLASENLRLLKALNRKQQLALADLLNKVDFS